MSHRIILAALLVGFVASHADAQNRFHRRRGAIFGGLAGAAVGAAIGDKGDNETAGALIGGAVGAIAGGAIGDQKDRRIEERHHHAYQTHKYQQQLHHTQAQADWQAQQFAAELERAEQAQAQQAQAARALSNADVIDLVRRGVAESTIVQYIKINGVARQLGVRDIISLHEQGISESIINAMQTAPVAQQPAIFDETPHRSGAPVLAPPVTSAAPEVIYDDSSIGVKTVKPPRNLPPLVDPTKPYVFPQ